MKTTLKKSDFVLHPYMKSNNFIATYQVINTIVPYILLWFLAFQLSKISIFLLPPIILLITLFSLRCFSLMHDCGHNSLFSSPIANRVVGFVFGVVNAMPQYWWSRDHAYHHKTNGDWEKYRGIGDFLSIQEYELLEPSNRALYRLLRHPLMIFPGGFFYLAFKPRLILLAGAYDFVLHLFASDWRHSSLGLSNSLSSYQAKHWGSAAEFWDILLNNLCVVGGWLILGRFLGAGFFFGVYSSVLTLSAAAFICIFFVQHNFEGAYAHKTEGWDYLLGAVEGSSYLEIPAILKWFTADISYHSIHHLSARIPNYNLKACHEANHHLFANMTTLGVEDLIECSRFILWDAATNQLVSIENYR